MMDMEKGVTNMNLINMDAFSPVEVPPTIKQGAAAEQMAFSIGESALGAVLVARSADGVCAILIGSEAAELESDLATRFTYSKLVRNDRMLSNVLKILCFIEAPSEGLNLALERNAVPTARLGRIAQDSTRVHRDLRGARQSYRSTRRCSGRCKCLRCQRDRLGYPVPPGRQKQWHALHLPLGC
jgi:hypothetical protein